MSKLSEAIITRLGHAKRDGIQLKMSDVKSIIEEEGWKNWLLNNMPNDEHSAYGQLTTAINLSQFHLMPASWQARCQAGLIADMTGGLVEEVEMEQRYRQT